MTLGFIEKNDGKNWPINNSLVLKRTPYRNANKIVIKIEFAIKNATVNKYE